MAAMLGIASFLLNVALIGSNPIATFYLPFTRAFELLTGAVLACGWINVNQSSAASNWRAWIGVALIAVAAAILDSHRAFPGWWAVLPVAGSALLLSAPAAWVNRVVLASPPLVWIGLISYPLYLWHWPLLVFGGIIKFGPLTLLERDLILLASALLAWATYRFVEIPFRFGLPSRRKMFGLGAGMAMVAVAGIVVIWGRGFDFRLPPEIRAMASVPTESFKWRVHECLLDLSQETTFRRHLRRARSASAGSDLGQFDRRRPAARSAQGAGDARLRHCAADLQFLHSGAERRHREHAQLPRDQRQIFSLARQISRTSFRCTAPGQTSRQRGRNGRCAEERDECPCRCSRRSAGVAARASVRGAQHFHLHRA